MNNPRISIIVAVTDDDVIGTRPAVGNKGMLWRLPDDMARFKRLTTGHTIVMGSATYRAMGATALPNRNNVVVSRVVPEGADCGFPRWFTHRTGGLWCGGLKLALEAALSLESDVQGGEVFIAGGARIYEQALDEAPGGLPTDLRVNRIYLTRVHACAGSLLKEEHTSLELVRFRLPNQNDWRCDRGEFHPSDGRHAHAFTFTTLDRRV